MKAIIKTLLVAVLFVSIATNVSAQTKKQLKIENAKKDSMLVESNNALNAELRRQAETATAKAEKAEAELLSLRNSVIVLSNENEELRKKNATPVAKKLVPDTSTVSKNGRWKKVNGVWGLADRKVDQLEDSIRVFSFVPAKINGTLIIKDGEVIGIKGKESSIIMEDETLFVYAGGKKLGKYEEIFEKSVLSGHSSVQGKLTLSLLSIVEEIEKDLFSTKKGWVYEKTGDIINSRLLYYYDIYAPQVKKYYQKNPR